MNNFEKVKGKKTPSSYNSKIAFGIDINKPS